MPRRQGQKPPRGETIGASSSQGAAISIPDLSDNQELRDSFEAMLSVLKISPQEALCRLSEAYTDKPVHEDSVPSSSVEFKAAVASEIGVDSSGPQSSKSASKGVADTNSSESSCEIESESSSTMCTELPSKDKEKKISPSLQDALPNRACHTALNDSHSMPQDNKLSSTTGHLHPTPCSEPSEARTQQSQKQLDSNDDGKGLGANMDACFEPDEEITLSNDNHADCEPDNANSEMGEDPSDLPSGLVGYWTREPGGAKKWVDGAPEEFTLATQLKNANRVIADRAKSSSPTPDKAAEEADPKTPKSKTKPRVQNATEKQTPRPNSAPRGRGRGLKSTALEDSSARSSPAPVAAPPPKTDESFVGLKVRKYFKGHGTFVGTVAKFRPKVRLFHIQYEDGDSEEMEREEVEQYLIQEDGNTKAKSAQGKDRNHPISIDDDGGCGGGSGGDNGDEGREEDVDGVDEVVEVDDEEEDEDFEAESDATPEDSPDRKAAARKARAARATEEQDQSSEEYILEDVESEEDLDDEDYLQQRRRRHQDHLAKKTSLDRHHIVTLVKRTAGGGPAPDKASKKAGGSSSGEEEEELVVEEEDDQVDEESDDDEDKPLGQRKSAGGRKTRSKARPVSSSDEEDGGKSKGQSRAKSRKDRRKRRAVEKSDEEEEEEEEEEEDAGGGDGKGGEGRRRKRIRKDKGLSLAQARAAKEGEEADRRRLKLGLELPAEVVACLPSTVLDHMQDHQREGVSFMWHCVEERPDARERGCILAHCMGLGKTLQVVALCQAWLMRRREGLAQKEREGKPSTTGEAAAAPTAPAKAPGNGEEAPPPHRVLVLCPVNTILNWATEFDKWLPSAPAPATAAPTRRARRQRSASDSDEEGEQAVKGDDEGEEETDWARRGQRRGPGGLVYPAVFVMADAKAGSHAELLGEWEALGGILIMGYENYRNLVQGKTGGKNAGDLKAIVRRVLVVPGPHMVICDEGHILRNAKSGLSVALSGIGTRRRVVLTGTPLQNNLLEYHCMINFVRPGLLKTERDFSRDFVAPILNGQCVDSTKEDVRKMKYRISVLGRILKGVVDRRDYSVLRDYLPPKYEYVIAIRLSRLQSRLYSRYLNSIGADSSASAPPAVATTAGVPLMPAAAAAAAVMQATATASKPRAMVFEAFHMLSRVWTHPGVLQMESSDVRPRSGAGKGRARGRRGYDSMDDFIASSDEEETDSSEEEARRKRRAKQLRKDKEKRAKAAAAAASAGAGSSAANEASGEMGALGEGVTKWWGDMLQGVALTPLALGASCEEPYEETTSGKLLFLMEVLRLAEEEGDKVLVFTQSLLMIELVERALEGSGERWKLGSTYFRLDGSTDKELREAWINEFNRSPRARMFILSTRAGGLGINLVAANRIVVMDASWNPSYDQQAVFRAYRFGQTRPVHIYRLVAYGTMEEKVYNRQVTKNDLATRVVDRDKDEQFGRFFTDMELRNLYDFDVEGKSAEDIAEARAESEGRSKGGGSSGGQAAAARVSDAALREAKVGEEDGIEANSCGKKVFNYLGLPTKEDPVLTKLLRRLRPQWVVGYHPTDSLIDPTDARLTEEEESAAWDEYERREEQEARARQAEIQARAEAERLRREQYAIQLQAQQQYLMAQQQQHMLSQQQQQQQHQLPQQQGQHPRTLQFQVQIQEQMLRQAAQLKAMQQQGAPNAQYMLAGFPPGSQLPQAFVSALQRGGDGAAAAPGATPRLAAGGLTKAQAAALMMTNKGVPGGGAHTGVGGAYVSGGAQPRASSAVAGLAAGTFVNPTQFARTGAAAGAGALPAGGMVVHNASGRAAEGSFVGGGYSGRPAAGAVTAVATPVMAVAQVAQQADRRMDDIPIAQAVPLGIRVAAPAEGEGAAAGRAAPSAAQANPFVQLLLQQYKMSYTDVINQLGHSIANDPVALANALAQQQARRDLRADSASMPRAQKPQ